PTVDAVKELTSVVSPVGKVFWGMSAKAIGLIRGRIRKSKQDEILPQKQEEANKNEARSNKERNRLLLRLIDAVRGSSGGGDGGGLAGLLGGGKGGKGGKLGKLGKLLGRAGKRLPLLGALLGGGMLASEWGDLDKKGKAGGIGELLGGGVGGVAGAFVGGPAGAVAGGVAGAYLGKIFGEKVSVWVDEMRNEDFAGIFKRVVSDMFSTKANVTKSAFVPFSLPAMAMGWGAKVGTGVRNWASNTFGGGSSAGVTPYSSENFDYSNAAGNKNAAGNVASDRKARQLGMFNALRKVGIADDRALALVGQIGRENDFSDKMFSTHIDPAKDKKGKDIKNGGVLSWNGDRYKKFSAFMRERGLMNANGEMPKTQAALDAQAAFIKQEMGSSDYKGKMGKFHDGKKRDARDYAQELAAYIGWARGQDTIRGANGTRVSFDWLSQDKKANRYTDDTAELAKRQSDQIKAAEAPAKTMPNAKGKATAPVIFKPNAARPPAVKVPAITPEIAKIGRKDKPQVTAQNTGGIGQTVSDRGLAHILSGGLGYNGQNA
ncbi:hypothetical protein, partial [Acinetobacter sp. ANC 3813]|uniref:hypothetical protein n=1 Tax=Acinetobacter sp. ANC 3813 TaxID=1977873 RepID=UPI00148A77DA